MLPSSGEGIGLGVDNVDGMGGISMKFLGNGGFDLEGAAERDRRERTGVRLKGSPDEGVKTRGRFPAVLDEDMQMGR